MGSVTIAIAGMSRRFRVAPPSIADRQSCFRAGKIRWLINPAAEERKMATLGTTLGVCFLILASHPAAAAGFSADCETRAVEKDHAGNSLSEAKESTIHVDATVNGMTLSGNGSESKYSALKTESAVASYYMNGSILKYSMRSPAGAMDIKIDRTSGEIYEIIDTKGRVVIIRGYCKMSGAPFKS